MSRKSQRSQRGARERYFRAVRALMETLKPGESITLSGDGLGGAPRWWRTQWRRERHDKRCK